MGQKVNPIGLRLGINNTWKSKWYAGSKDYADFLHEDLIIRKVLAKCPETHGADISDIEIVRKPERINVLIKASRPGVLIGSKGANIDKLALRLQKHTSKKISIKIKEVKKPEVDAQLIALNVAQQLKMRGSFKRALKMSVSSAMRAGAQGVKIKVSGRLGGAEMARTEWHKEGRVPLHTLRSDIDYGFAEAVTTFGVIGVKVWVFKGEVLKNAAKQDAGLLVKSNRREKEGVNDA